MGVETYEEDNFEYLIEKFNRTGPCKIKINDVCQIDWHVRIEDNTIMEDIFIIFYPRSVEFRMIIVQDASIVFKVTIPADQAKEIIKKLDLFPRSAGIGFGCTYRSNAAWEKIDSLA